MDIWYEYFVIWNNIINHTLNGINNSCNLIPHHIDDAWHK